MASLGMMHGLIAFKYGGIELGEELVVQRLDGSAEVRFCDREADVQQRRALGNHADIDSVESVEHAARHAGSEANVVAHEADNSLVVFHIHLGELAEVGHDRVQIPGGVDRERYAY